MTTHINQQGYQVRATEALAKFRAMTLAGTIAQAVDKRAAGICVTDGASGYNATAIYDGITKAFIGGAVNTLGYPLKIANSGWLVAASSGDVYCARALNTGASGDLLEVSVDFDNLAPANV